MAAQVGAPLEWIFLSSPYNWNRGLFRGWARVALSNHSNRAVHDADPLHASPGDQSLLQQVSFSAVVRMHLAAGRSHSLLGRNDLNYIKLNY